MLLSKDSINRILLDIANEKMTEEEYYCRFSTASDNYGDIMSFDPEKEAKYEQRRMENSSQST